MKRSASILLAVVLAAALLLSMAWQANAQATRIEVASYEYDCLTGLEEEYVQGQVYHLRNVYHTNIDVSDSPELNGINKTVADAEVNLNTGTVVIRGTMSFEPYELDGTWEGNWTSIETNGIVKAWAVAHGTGALSGKILFLNIYDTPYNPETEVVCAGIGIPQLNVITEGYILDTGAP